jgi:hypothetical protein
MKGQGRLVSATPSLPTVLGLRCGDGLPLEVPDRIGTPTGERLNVILPVAWTSTAGFAGRWAGMLTLELPRYLSGSELSRRQRAGKGEHNRQRDNCHGARARCA